MPTQKELQEKLKELKHIEPPVFNKHQNFECYKVTKNEDKRYFDMLPINKEQRKELISYLLLYSNEQ